MKKITINSLILVFLSVNSVYAQQGRGGTNTAAFLKLGVGARPTAMGEAYVALSDEIFGLHFNPAGLARISRNELGFMHLQLKNNQNLEDLRFTAPVDILGVAGNIGVALSYMDLGGVERTTFSSVANGISLGEATANALQMSAAYSSKVNEVLDAGGTLKLIYQRLDDVQAVGAGLDIGVIYHTPLRGLNLGASFSNIGSRLRFIKDSELIPFTFRSGMALSTFSDYLKFTLDFVYRRNESVTVHAGSEFNWRDIFYARIGFNPEIDVEADAAGITAGAGFHYNDIRLDYAFVPMGEIGDAHRVSANYRFGPSREKKQLVHPVTTPVKKEKKSFKNWFKDRVSKRKEPGQKEKPVEKRISRKHKKPKPPEIRTVYIEPLLLMMGAEEDEWLGDAILDITKIVLEEERGYRMTSKPDEADITVKGFYYVEENNIHIYPSIFKNNVEESVNEIILPLSDIETVGELLTRTITQEK